jgi:hypothetical protein
MCATLEAMRSYVHARLGKDERILLEQLKQVTGDAASEIVRRGLQLVAENVRRRPSALDLAGRSVGRFTKGPRDLSASKRHLKGFGE